MAQKEGLLGPDGKPIPRTVTVKVNGKSYPYRVVNQEVFAASKIDPQVGLMAVLVQAGDMNNLTFLAMLALAKDIYSRQPEGTRHFEELVNQLNMNIIDIERNSTSMTEELKNL